MRHALLVFAACAIHTADAFAQDSAGEARRARGKWALLDALGYGALGTVVSFPFAYAIGDDGEDAAGLLVLAGGTIGGIATGAAIGRGVQHRIRDGRPVGAGRATAAVMGVVFAGAAIGSLAAIPLIEGEGEGTPLGSDETAFAVLAGGGATLGALYALKHGGELRGPRVSVGRRRTDDGRDAYALGLRLSF